MTCLSQNRFNPEDQTRIPAVKILREVDFLSFGMVCFCLHEVVRAIFLRAFRQRIDRHDCISCSGRFIFSGIGSEKTAKLLSLDRDFYLPPPPNCADQCRVVCRREIVGRCIVCNCHRREFRQTLSSVSTWGRLLFCFAE